MTAQDERKEFSERLQQALENANMSSDSPTQLSRDFNAHFQGQPVTVHGARKWLMGEAIPTQEKIRVLADMLNVKIEWLRFGSGSGKQKTKVDGVPHAHFMFIAQFNALSKRNQLLVSDFMGMLRTRKEA